MDVLDHSCSKLGFGGKMCIDGTVKTIEEQNEHYGWESSNSSLNEDFLKSKFPEVKGVNLSLLKQNIPCIIISVKKDRLGHIRELHNRVADLSELESVKMILYVEHTVDAKDLPIALWRFCNNLDPKRDSILAQRNSLINQGRQWACMGLDGTIKTKEMDNFGRDWPNIIVADDETILSVDAKWDQLGIGAFISSPSLKFKGQLYGEEAVVAT